MLNIIPITTATTGSADGPLLYRPCHGVEPARRIDERLAEQVSILDFAAHAEGSDFTPAFQAAVDYLEARDGGELLIPARPDQHYRIQGTITVATRSGIHFRALGHGGSRNTKGAVRLEKDNAGAMFDLRGSDAKWRGCTFSNLELRGNPLANAIESRDFNNTRLKSCQITGFDTGIKFIHDDVFNDSSQYWEISETNFTSNLIGVDLATRFKDPGWSRTTDISFLSCAFQGRPAEVPGVNSNAVSVPGTYGIRQLITPEVDPETGEEDRGTGGRFRIINCHFNRLQYGVWLDKGVVWMLAGIENSPGNDWSELTEGELIGVTLGGSGSRVYVQGGGHFDKFVHLNERSEGNLVEIGGAGITQGLNGPGVVVGDDGSNNVVCRLGEGAGFQQGAVVVPTADPGFANALFAADDGTVRVSGNAVPVAEASIVRQFRQERSYGFGSNARSILFSLPAGAAIIEIRGTVLATSTADQVDIGLGVGGTTGDDVDAQHFVRKSTFNPSPSPDADNPTLAQVTLDSLTEQVTCQWSPPSPHVLAEDTAITDIWINRQGTVGTLVVRWEIDYVAAATSVAATPI